MYINPTPTKKFKFYTIQHDKRVKLMRDFAGY